MPTIGPKVFCNEYNDDDAIDGSDANEDVLGYDALKGDWAISIPCDADDLEWVAEALLRHSDRITARDKDEGVAVKSSDTSATTDFTIDAERMSRS